MKYMLGHWKDVYHDPWLNIYMSTGLNSVVQMLGVMGKLILVQYHPSL